MEEMEICWFQTLSVDQLSLVAVVTMCSDVLVTSICTVVALLRRSDSDSANYSGGEQLNLWPLLASLSGHPAGEAHYEAAGNSGAPTWAYLTNSTSTPRRVSPGNDYR